ncbi:hypothetical protein D6D38_13320 [Rahnella variigena]|nr:hypothetical protein D6D38_13320 [Rahnella variigena]
MFHQPQRQAGNLAALRCLHSVLKPLVFRPLRSARFLNRPQHFKNKESEVVKSKPRAGSKIPPEERRKTVRLFARVVARTEGTAQRRNFAAIASLPET